MLTARYTVALTAPLHTTWLHTVHTAFAESDGTRPAESEVFSQEHRPVINTRVNDFDVRVELLIEVVKNPLLAGHSSVGTQTLKVSLSSDIAKPTELLGPDAQQSKQQWDSVCRLVVDRTVDYCRYVLGYPFLRNASGTTITSEGWFDESNSLVVPPPPGPNVFAQFPGMPGILDSKHLTRARLDGVLIAIRDGKEYLVKQEILAQAREAIYERQLLKAVLLLAIASEVAIKTSWSM